MSKSKKHKAAQKIKTLDKKIIYGLIVVFVVLSAVNQSMILNINNSVVKTASVSASSAAATTTVNSILDEIIPTGMPAVYGSELGVSFDDVSAANPQKADATIGIFRASIAAARMQ